MLLAINKSVADMVRNQLKVDVASVDKIEGLDSKRPICTVDIDLLVSIPLRYNYSKETVRVQIDYYGTSNKNLIEVSEKLNTLFSLVINVGNKVFLIDNKTTRKSNLNILEFEFTLEYIREIKCLCEEEHELMGEINIKGVRKHGN